MSLLGNLPCRNPERFKFPDLILIIPKSLSDTIRINFTN